MEKKDFDSVFSSVNKKAGTLYFTGLFKKNNNNETTHIGIIISKKNVKKATKRNLIKRIIKESFRLNKEKLEKGILVVLIKKEINQLKNKKEIRQKIDNLWEKLKV